MNIEVKKIASSLSPSVSDNTYKPKVQVPEPRNENEIDIHENPDSVYQLPQIQAPQPETPKFNQMDYDEGVEGDMEPIRTSICKPQCKPNRLFGNTNGRVVGVEASKGLDLSLGTKLIIGAIFATVLGRVF